MMEGAREFCGASLMKALIPFHLPSQDLITYDFGGGGGGNIQSIAASSVID